MLTLAAAIGIGRFAFTPVLPMMQRDLDLSLRAAGWLASANYAGYFAGALSAVWLRLAPGAIVRGSLAATALLTIGMGLTHDLGVWMVLRALAGELERALLRPFLAVAHVRARINLYENGSYIWDDHAPK